MTPRLDRGEFLEQFGSRLREYRASRGYSQMSLAYRAGYGVGTISNLERGLYMPALTVVFVLAETLEVDPQHLLFGEKE